ncbi:hypothetical protein EYF80_023379 [Liparis tanakae]|uniref:Uncharacterized protein n=1 Tax=Liparis tanakae TaxID=230148 RepID=A0A4Z2HLS3_9TELE|nr:hypothetical protein EYF80_023379 [Liparis tanakae]
MHRRRRSTSCVTRSDGLITQLFVCRPPPRPGNEKAVIPSLILGIECHAFESQKLGTAEPGSESARYPPEQGTERAGSSGRVIQGVGERRQCEKAIVRCCGREDRSGKPRQDSLKFTLLSDKSCVVFAFFRTGLVNVSMAARSALGFFVCRCTQHCAAEQWAKLQPDDVHGEEQLSARSTEREVFVCTPRGTD